MLDLPQWVRWLEQSVLAVMICMLGIWIVHRLPPWRAPRELGLVAPPHVGIVFGLLATLPMLVPCLIWGRLAAEIDPVDLLYGATIWPMAEEIIFRGYTF